MYIILGTGKGDRKTGYIAESFLEEATSRGIDCICLSRKSIDYTDYKTFSEYIDNYWKTFSKDTVVINCAGYTGKPNVDACELNKDQAILGNIVLPTMLSEVCESRELPFVHISSGCIYNGDDKHFSEDDEPNFTFNTGSFYSGTKASLRASFTLLIGTYFSILDVSKTQLDLGVFITPSNAS